MVYTTKITRINYLAASKMIAAAVARADQMNVPQCIAIMDTSGGLVCFARTDGAADLASGPAYAKARVAAERQHPSGALPEEFEVGVAFATGGQYTNLPGGLPIVLDGIHIGWEMHGRIILLSYCQHCLFFLIKLILPVDHIQIQNKFKNGEKHP